MRHFLVQHLDCNRIREDIKRGHLYARAISATNFSSGKSYLFIQGTKGHPMWNRTRRAIGVRGHNLEHQEEASDIQHPSVAQVLGILFNVMFLDHLANDVQHLDRLNQLLESGRFDQSDIYDCEKIHPLKALLITPSIDLSELAHQHQRDMPYLIQYFVKA